MMHRSGIVINAPSTATHPLYEILSEHLRNSNDVPNEFRLLCWQGLSARDFHREIIGLPKKPQRVCHAGALRGSSPQDSRQGMIQGETHCATRGDIPTSMAKSSD